jgi:hypothetical protein
MRAYYALQPVVADVQEMYLQSAIGKDLLKYLIELANPNADETYCIALLKKALAYLTIKHACTQLPIRISDAGLTISSMMSDQENSDASGREGASAAMIEKLEKDCDKQGQNYLSKARFELNKYRNAGTSSVNFNTEYDKGPLIGYKTPDERSRGNDDRKIFVM